MREALIRAFEGVKKTAVSLVRGYAVIVWSRSEGAGADTVKTLIRAGPLSWLGLLLLLANVIVTIHLTLQAQDYPILRTAIWEGEEIAVPTPALYLSLLFIDFGWAYLLCGAARMGPLAYLFAAAYTAFYGLYAGINLAGTLWIALPSLWMLALGTWAAGALPTSRWKRPILLALSLLVALITYSSLGIKDVAPFELGMWGRVALGGIYFALTANPWALRKRPWRPGYAFATTSIIFAAFYAASLQRSPAQEVLANTFLAVNGLLGLVALFWYWVGLDLFNEAQDLAEWLVEGIRTAVPERALTATIFSLWFTWSILARFLAFTPPLPLVEFLRTYGWGRMLLRLPSKLSMDLLAALNYDFYATTAIAFVALVLWRARRLSSEGLIWLFGLSLAAFFTLQGYFGNLFEITSEEMRASLLPLAIYVGGMIWEIFKMGPGLLTAKGSPQRARLFLFLGFLLLLGGISHLELVAGYPELARELSLNPLLGILYLGLPYLLYTLLYQQKHYTPVPPRHLLLLFALGMLSAIPALLLKAILLAPALWLMIMLGTVWRWGRWDEIWDGLAYTIAPALGFVTFYAHPIFIPIPAFTAQLAYLTNIQQRYMLQVIYPWDPAWWRIVLGTLGAAATMGYLLSAARLSGGRRRLLLILLSLLAGLACLVLCELTLGF